jgi:hypothetical protein
VSFKILAAGRNIVFPDGPIALPEKSAPQSMLERFPNSRALYSRALSGGARWLFLEEKAT